MQHRPSPINDLVKNNVEKSDDINELEDTYKTVKSESELEYTCTTENYLINSKNSKVTNIKTI